MIRGLINRCPFGLPIPNACKCIGGNAIGTDVMAVEIMSPVNDELDDRDEIYEENMELYNSVEDPKKCPYAESILKGGKDDCKFDELNSDFISNQLPLNGSPEYPSVMIGNSSSPGFGIPPHNYSDNNNSTVYYGIYSLIS